VGDVGLPGQDQLAELIRLVGHRPLPGLVDQLGRLLQLGLVLGVGVVPEVEQRRGHALARVVEDRDAAVELTGLLLVEQPAPGRLGIVADRLGVHAQAGRAPLVRHRVGQARVVGRVGELVSDVLAVGDQVVIELEEHALLDHDLDHVVRRDDDVVVGAARADLGEQRLVRGERVLARADAELVAERGQQVGVHVLGPVVEQQVAVDLAGLAVDGRGLRLLGGRLGVHRPRRLPPRARSPQGPRHRRAAGPSIAIVSSWLSLFTCIAPPDSSRRLGRFGVSRRRMTTRASSTSRIEPASIRTETALISGVTPRRRAPNTYTGNVVDPAPLTNSVMTTSSSESVRASSARPRRPAR
jgi:hypothetical protein